MSFYFLIYIFPNRATTDVIELRKRYSNMYIPSDFFHSNFQWMQAFPLHRPLTLGNQCSFHIMNKEVEPIVKGEPIPEPADCSYLFSAKVWGICVNT